ncbi:RNA-dependent RNA polymerase [Mal de Rio Cuarto virus]|uniref:RNA-dependent RNA polymerase n=1 Tax=Mal de Rio Cuarto virus TaxID=185954 RepID=Q809F1_9REOV|nr:RNA-dependent RNA polymerase [Mal de Rio Cuarto virus]AAO73182.1 RNA-dependent RNA polymerase [Mal de Rio Cuarto virus]
MVEQSFSRSAETCLKKFKQIQKHKTEQKLKNLIEEIKTTNGKTSQHKRPFGKVTAKEKFLDIEKLKFQVLQNQAQSESEYASKLLLKDSAMDGIIANAEEIRNTLIGEIPLTREIIESKLKDIALVLNNASDLILKLFENDGGIEKSCIIPISVIEKDIFGVLHPIEIFDYNAFGIDEVNNLAINPKIRYLPNWNVQKIRDTIDKLKDDSSYVKAKSLSKDYGIVSNSLKRQLLIGVDRMFNKLSIQHRFGTFESQMFSCFLMKQILTEEQSYVNLPECVSKKSFQKRGVDTVCWQYLRQILLHYGTFPFYHHTHSSKFGVLDSTRISIQTDKPVSCILPSVLHGLLSGIVSELLCDLNSETALIYAKHLMNCSNQSTYQRQLDFKDSFRSWTKLCYDKIGYVLAVSYSEDMKPLDQRIERIESEFWADDIEKSNLEKSVDNLPNYMKPFVKSSISNCVHLGKAVGSKMSSNHSTSLCRDLIDEEIISVRLLASKNTDYLRWLTMTSTIVSNFGIYNKTSLLLEYEKSVGTREDMMVQRPDCKVSIVTEQGLSIPLINDWTKVPILNEMSELFDYNWKSDLIKEFESIDDFEKRFVTFLTNKSGGQKSDEPTLSKELKGISNARVIAFALNRNDYHDESKFLKMLMTYGKCAIRFQIDRRARVIVIVPNAIQSSELFLLLGFNSLKKDKKHNSKIAVGKQIGNLLDARLQMSTTGDVSSIKNSGDMKGMDAHTIPNLTLFLRNKMIEVLYELDPSKKCTRYFFSEDKDYILKEKHDKFEEMYTRKLRGVVIHAAKCLYYMFSMNMFLDDHFFADSLTVSDQTFQSGFFATSAQHTLFLNLFLLNLERKFFASQDNKMISVMHSVMGDDVLEVIKNGVKFPDIVRKWLLLRKQDLTKLNYEEELSLSRIFGVFLQQAAILGVYVPYPTRMSLFCDERSDTTKRHVLDMMKIVMDVISAKSQRSYGIDNGLGIGYAIWACHRSSRYIYSDSDKRNIEALLNLDKSLDFTFICSHDEKEQSIRFIYPFVSIMCSPISWPMLTFAMTDKDDPNKIITYKSKAFTSLNGDGAYMLINQMFFTSNEQHMFQFVDCIKHQSKIVELKLNPNFLDWDERHSWGFTLGEHLLRFKRLRHLTESRKNQLGLGDIEVMVHNLNKYLDGNRVLMSFNSIAVLRSRKIEVSFGLMYVNHNRSKIDQSLTVRTESLEERLSLDSIFLKHVLYYKKVPSDIEVLKTHALCSVRLRIYGDFDYAVEHDGLIQPSEDSKFNVILPFLPGYHLNSSYGKLFLYSSLPTVHDRDISGTLGEITGSLGAAFDVDSAVEFGAHVYNINPSLVDAAGAAIGIPQSLLKNYKNLVDAFITNNFNLKYHSIFQNVKYFGLNGSLKLFSSFGDYSSRLVRFDVINKLSKFHNVFVRDFIFAYIHELNGRRVYLDYSLHSLLLVMSRGSIKYFTSHLNQLFNPMLSLELD